MEMRKKGYFFSLDAFLALLIILAVVFFIQPSSTQITQETNVQNDLLRVLSNLKVGEADNEYIRELIVQGDITNPNQSLLEQIGEFYANSDSKAASLTQNILNELDLDENIALYFNNQLIASSQSLDIGDSERIWTSRQIISGIDNNVGAGAKGFSSRAFLFSKNNVDYIYFGGYVGDGNLTVYLGKNVVSAKTEAIFSNFFNISVNEGAVVEHRPSSNEPYEFTLNEGFVSGDNYLYFTSSNNLYIAGGFIRVVYNDTEGKKKKNKSYFPGIDGFINLYDGFYVPGILNSMEIFLHYNSAFNVFLSIGNKTVYSGNGSEIQTTLTDADFQSVGLDYSTMNYKTIPLRLGLENVSYVLNTSLDADVFSVTDLSGSMDADCSGAGFWCCLFSGNFCETNSTCTDCGGIWEDKMNLAKEANKVFIDDVLEGGEENRVGLIGYSDHVDVQDYFPLSRDDISLKSKVDEWDSGGATCICCGINYGVDRLNAESDSSKFRSLVVMSDGQANRECARQGTGNASKDAIQAACDAAAQGIQVYAVAFGADADVNVLESVASCGEGSFYFGNVTDLISIYEDIAEEIINAAYFEQTIVGEGFKTTLYPDSYISLDYQTEVPYGLIVTAESEDFGDDSIGNFSLLFDAVPYKAVAVSYSGSKWTSQVQVYNNVSNEWEIIFNLSDYGEKYTDLGDPYFVNIPVEKLKPGENSVKVLLGLRPANLTSGPEYNKIIYSVIKNLSGFSPILSSAEGCIWTIEFEDGTNSTMNIPEDYSGNDTCNYSSENFIYNNNDAIDYAIFKLLSSLDLNSNGKIERRFTEQDLTISSTEIEGIPFVWETEAQVRVWR